MILLGDKKIADVRLGERGIEKVLQGEKVLWQRRRVPVEYQEVEYLESTGEQWIDTGVTSGIHSVKTVVQMLEQNAGIVFGSYSADISKRLYFGVHNGNWSYATYNSFVNTSSAVPYRQTVEYSWDYKSVNFRVGSESYQSGVTSPDYSDYRSIVIFARNSDGVVNAFSKMRMYSFEMDNISNLIPCYRKSDFKPGMYDTVSKQFFVNQGTGADFILGPEVNSELPAGYKRCEYLESSKKQYVNLGIIYAFEFSIDCYIESHVGGFLGYYKNPYEVIIQPNSAYAYVGASSTNKDTTVKLPFDGRLEFSGNKLYVNGVHTYTSPSSPVVPSSRDFLLFGYMGANANLGIGKIRSLKIRNAKYETIYNFVPSIDQSGKPCMYDTVSKKPFYNQGTGEFGYELLDGTYVAPV